MSERRADPAADNGQTADLPSAPPHPGPSTARAADTDLRTGHPDAARETAELASDPSAQTGAFAPTVTPDDPSAVTGGYTPAARAKAVVGEPAVRGYEILGELGRGGMGVVYKARQVGLDRLVALKMILAGAHARPKDLDRFRAEAQAVARFQHPGIVQIYEVGEADGLPYFSLEFVDGGTLATRVAREPQPPRFAAETVEALARAMQYAHDRGVVHRDLKPANVLLAADGTPKVTDFGLAKRLEQDSGTTQAGTVLGTPSYMAPEQAMGADQAGPAADVYALGAILYDLLTGRPPFAGSSVLDTLEMVRTREPVPPGQLTGKLPRDLETVCLKCLQKEPARRYASAGELAEDLRRYLDGRPIVARPVGAPERAWRWARRNPWVAGLGSATALLVLTVAVVTSILSYRLNERKKEAEANFLAAKAAEAKEAEERKKAEDAHELEKKAREVRDAQAILALNALRGTSIYVDQIMSRKASLRPLRLDIQRVTLRDLEALRKHMLQNPLEGRTEAGAYQRMGEVYLAANKVAEAADVLRKAHAVSAKFMRDNPDDPVGPRNLAGITNALGEVELRLGDAEAARTRYVAALALRRQWAGMLKPADVPVARSAIATSHALIGRAHLELGEPAEALAAFLAADEEYGRLPQPKGAEALGAALDRLEVRDGIGECLYRLGKPAEAEAQYLAVLKEREALAAKYRGANPAGAIARSHLSLGDFYLFDRQDPGRALAHYRVQYAAFRAAAADPDDLVAKRNLATMHYRLGYATGRLAAPLPAAPAAALRATSDWHYLTAVALSEELAGVDGTDTRSQIDLMLAQARLGRAEAAEKLAAGLLAQAGKDRRILFQTACGLAIAGGGSGPAADRCRDQAFRALGTLLDRGWKDRVTLATDPDLEAVRGDERFARLLARIPK